ncbi:hypothetical protein H5410_004887 [Solanum commersonii]|uniref:Uncharacterized protein n=1 Tax=Solanum commersonii TaxID=4109 RepID=A0A9J6A534_SOLCO|nr:hypothetical protein H5410_004887 [Solanum commersonii]
MSSVAIKVNPLYIPPTSSTCSSPLLVPTSLISTPTLTSASSPTFIATSSSSPGAISASLLMVVAPSNSLFIILPVESDFVSMIPRVKKNDICNFCSVETNDPSVATDGPSIGRKLNSSKLSSFLPTDDPYVAVDGTSIESKLNNSKLSVLFQQMTHLLQQIDHLLEVSKTTTND